ncbi:hypothetical protein ACKWTF_000916 [Chironomus riparius]
MKVKFLSTNSFVRNFFSNNIFRQSDEVTKLISQSGYKGERHQVKTQDGYYLTVHRILPKKNVEYKGTVFLMHGLFRNSADYIATGPKVALPYLLSDNGFDCYLGNARGSKYCQEHVKHPYNSKSFWNFSWEEIGLYDLPAMIDFAIDKSNSSKVNYIGHSQGCTTAVALLASRPEYNKFISQLHLMAPAVFMNGATTIAFSFWNRAIFKILSKYLDTIDITPILQLIKKLSERNGENPEKIIKIYKSITCKFVGQNKKEVQLSLEAIKAFNHFMSPKVSKKQLMHYLQLYQTGKFQRFDHKDQNQTIYGSSTPPEYILSNVTAPTYLYHAEQDILTDKSGIDRFSQELPHQQAYRVIPDFNHIDLMLGKDARELLYKDMLQFMLKTRI